MTDQDIKRLIDRAKKELALAKKFTKEQALASLVSAGILTKKGNYTKPKYDFVRINWINIIC